MKRIGCLLALALAGCGPSGPVSTHPVGGSVTYDGRPAAGVSVYLVPTSAPMVPDVPHNPHGVTDESGRFRLTTFKDHDGAAEGGYQVVLLWPKGDPGAEGADVIEDRLLGWYTAARSKLTAHVKPGANELPPIRLTAVKGPPGEMKGVPGRN